MRAHRFVNGRRGSIFNPFSANNIFFRNNENTSRAVDQVYARKIANQFNYSNPAYSFYGYAGIGYARETGRTFTGMNWQNFAPSLFIVPADQPTSRVALLENDGSKERAPEALSNLQSFLEAVPVPDVLKVPAGRLTLEEGTDHHLTILQEGTRRLWEFWKWESDTAPFACRMAGYIDDVATWNGIWPNNWGARASSLMMMGGVLTMQDVANVLRGKKIEHALCCTLPVTGPGWVNPATRADVGMGEYHPVGIPELHEGTPNPAYPYTDAVPEGSWFCFPKSSNPQEFGLTGVMEKAIFEAIRIYGLTVVDGNSGSAKLYCEAPTSLGSRYSWCSIDARAGGPSTWTPKAINWIPASWEEPLLPKLTEEHSGEESFLTKQPWNQLERLAPFVS